MMRLVRTKFPIVSRGFKNELFNLGISSDTVAQTGTLENTQTQQTRQAVPSPAESIRCQDLFATPDLPRYCSVPLIMASTTKRADFEAVWPSLAQDILAHAKKYNLPQNALEWFEKVRYAPHQNWALMVQLKLG